MGLLSTTSSWPASLNSSGLLQPLAVPQQPWPCCAVHLHGYDHSATLHSMPLGLNICCSRSPHRHGSCRPHHHVGRSRDSTKSAPADEQHVEQHLPKMNIRQPGLSKNRIRQRAQMNLQLLACRHDTNSHTASNEHSLTPDSQTEKANHSIREMLCSFVNACQGNWDGNLDGNLAL